MAKKTTVIITETMPHDVIKRLADQIRAMNNWHELVAVIGNNADMAKFCGCKLTSSMYHKEDGAKDQWRAIRKERPWEK